MYLTGELTQPHEDAQNTAFWHRYWEVCTQRAAELEMREPGARPSGSSFIYFRPYQLPKSVEIVHKFVRGYLDLQIKGKGNRLNELREFFAPVLLEGMSIVPVGKSAAIRVLVPPLNPATDFDSQAVEIAECIDEAANVLEWFLPIAKEWRKFENDGDRNAYSG